MNKQGQGHEYRVRVLRALARLGYASTRQLARAVWWRCDTSTRKMCGRTLIWLLKKKLIVAKRAGGTVAGEQLVAVTALGASWLAEFGEPLPQGKAHARDWLRHAHSHRTACNSTWSALVGLFPDAAAWTELEIRAGIAPVRAVEYSFEGKLTSKVPDVLAERAHGYEWVEVENTWRSGKDLDKVVAFMRSMYLRGDAMVMHFVIAAPGAKSIGQRLRRKLTHAADSGWPRQVKEADAMILAKLKVSLLDRETLTLSPVPF